jgi:uncharacterized protein YjbJ (UPF0337 family)
MTSWNRGRENEEVGEQQLSDGDASNNLEGAARKIGGEIEQALDDLGDTLSGKQHDLEGKSQNWGTRYDDTIDEIGDRIDHTGYSPRLAGDTGTDVSDED